MKLIRLILATTPALLLAAVALPVRSAVTEFYVAPNGADAWSGARPEPNTDRTDGPFATLVREREAVRRLNASGTNTHPVTVLVRGGEHRLSEPLVLGPEDSRANGRPVTYAAYPGERHAYGFDPSRQKMQKKTCCA
jgi:acetyl esterase/lipase